MTSIEIQLPDHLAREAARAGLFTPQCVEALFSKQLRTGALVALLERNRAPASEAMSLEELQVEIDAVRAEKRRSDRP